MSADADIDAKIPETAVLAAVTAFLEGADWRLEFDEGPALAIPRQPAPVVASRAYVKAHAPDIFLGGHYEAVVYLAPEVLGDNWLATAGTLKLYFNLDGDFVSEDRYPPHNFED